MTAYHIPSMIRAQITSASLMTAEAKAILYLDFATDGMRKHFVNLIIHADINNNKLKYWLSHHDGYRELEGETYIMDVDDRLPESEQIVEELPNYRLEFMFIEDRGISYAKAIYKALAKGD